MGRTRLFSLPGSNIFRKVPRSLISPAQFGAPVEVCPGPATGLPIPARAELVLEGMLLPPAEESLLEGPFGEFTGYYAAEKRPAPVMRVTATHHRSNPILLGSLPLKAASLPLRAAAPRSRDLEQS